MSEKPIIFSGAMARAILAGRKTQTRRVAKNDKPKYAIGDVLWVRETFYPFYGKYDKDVVYRADTSNGYLSPCESLSGGYPDYCRSGCDTCTATKWKPQWKPSIHMPRKAARLFLKVVNVRCERLQDISETDAKAEGVAFNMPVLETDNGRTAWEMTTARTKFCSLWDSLNAKRGYGWDTNPWVWIIEF